MPCHTRMKLTMQGLLWLFLLEFGLMVTSLEPGFLDFDNLPDTNFSCVGKVIGGYYADLETNCQMFHVCTIGQLDEPMDIRFLCLNGTVFDQETRVCERIDEVDCSKSEQFYSLNLELYGNTQPPILEESPEIDFPLDIKKSSTSTSTTTPTTSRPSYTKSTSQPFYTTLSPPTTTRSITKVITSHHFPIVNSPDIRFNPEEINISLNPGSPPDITRSQVPISYQQQSFSEKNTRVTVTTHTTVYKNDKPHRVPLLQSSNSPSPVLIDHENIERPQLVEPTVTPKSVVNYGLTHNQISQVATPTEINYGFTYQQTEESADYHTEVPPHPYQYQISLGGLRHHTPQGHPYLSSYQATSKRPHKVNYPAATTYRNHPAFTSSPKTSVSQQFNLQRTEKPPRLQLPLPLLPTLPPLAFSSPAPFSLGGHIETKRYTNDHQSPPRIIISASASVSDNSGRRLNYSLGTIGASHFLGSSPTSYDDYKEEDVVLDPFYHDVPKVKSTRHKRSALQEEDVIRDEQDAADLLLLLFNWYKKREKTKPITIPVVADDITEINEKLAPNSNIDLIANATEDYDELFQKLFNENLTVNGKAQNSSLIFDKVANVTESSRSSKPTSTTPTRRRNSKQRTTTKKPKRAKTSRKNNRQNLTLPDEEGRVRSASKEHKQQRGRVTSTTSTEVPQITTITDSATDNYADLEKEIELLSKQIKQFHEVPAVDDIEFTDFPLQFQFTSTEKLFPTEPNKLDGTVEWSLQKNETEITDSVPLETDVATDSFPYVTTGSPVEVAYSNNSVEPKLSNHEEEVTSEVLSTTTTPSPQVIPRKRNKKHRISPRRKNKTTEHTTKQFSSNDNFETPKASSKYRRISPRPELDETTNHEESSFNRSTLPITETLLNYEDNFETTEASSKYYHLTRNSSDDQGVETVRDASPNYEENLETTRSVTENNAYRAVTLVPETSPYYYEGDLETTEINSNGFVSSADLSPETTQNYDDKLETTEIGSRYTNSYATEAGLEISEELFSKTSSNNENDLVTTEIGSEQFRSDQNNSNRTVELIHETSSNFEDADDRTSFETLTNENYATVFNLENDTQADVSKYNTTAEQNATAQERDADLPDNSQQIKNVGHLELVESAHKSLETPIVPDYVDDNYEPLTYKENDQELLQSADSNNSNAEDFLQKTTEVAERIAENIKTTVSLDETTTDKIYTETAEPFPTYLTTQTFEMTTLTPESRPIDTTYVTDELTQTSTETIYTTTEPNVDVQSTTTTPPIETTTVTKHQQLKTTRLPWYRRQDNAKRKEYTKHRFNKYNSRKITQERSKLDDKLELVLNDNFKSNDSVKDNSTGDILNKEEPTTADASITDAPLLRSANPTKAKYTKIKFSTTPLTKFVRVELRKDMYGRRYSFNCFDKKIHQFYSDPRDCRLFHYCTSGYTKNQMVDMKFVCDLGTYFDASKLVCTKEKPARCI